MSGKRHATPRSDDAGGTPRAAGPGGFVAIEDVRSLGRGARGRAPQDAPTINLISLGCPKNLVDSEMILGNAGIAGFRITSSAEEADVIVINTCGFVDDAKEESVNTILEACELKRQGAPGKRVIVTGCLGQRYGEDLRREVPEVDAIIGLGQYDSIGATLRRMVDSESDEPYYRVADPNFACNAEVERLRLTPSHYAYVRISEGCDNPCTFCAIPNIRGRFRSKPLAAIEDEVRALVDTGCVEVVLISQDTTSYGVDLDGTYQLPRLLERVAAVPGVRWVRLLYVYPSCFSDDMIDAVAAIPQVVKYIDVPLQHIHESVLRRMGRRMGERSTRALLDRMRGRIPGLYLRTTFIVGFPGESDAEFATLRDHVLEFGYERLGVFPYSREEDTPAYRMKDSVPDDVVAARVEELMLTQQDVAFAQNERRVGEEVEILVDRTEAGESAGRTYGEAPDIDPVVYVRTERRRSVRPGELMRGRIVGTRDYDLEAEPLA